MPPLRDSIMVKFRIIVKSTINFTLWKSEVTNLEEIGKIEETPYQKPPAKTLMAFLKTLLLCKGCAVSSAYVDTICGAGGRNFNLFVNKRPLVTLCCCFRHCVNSTDVKLIVSLC